MALAAVKIGNLSVSRMIIGGNPFSGFSHQSRAAVGGGAKAIEEDPRLLGEFLAGM
jgi:hypothetical protein